MSPCADLAAPADCYPTRLAQKGRIEVRDFGLTYVTARGVIVAVSDVSLTVNPGEFVSVVGPSGCGKSTLLNALAGFLKPTSGRVTVDGETVIGPSADRGMIFQHYSLFPWKTVRQNVEFGLKMKGVSSARRQATARMLLQLTGLQAFENHYPDSLSGGMKQRVGIARALATSPRILLLDEPFGALDAQTRLIMQEILTDIWHRWKISVLLVTHDIDEAIFLSDRVYVMTAKPGRVKAEIPVPLGRPRDLAVSMSQGFLNLRAELRMLIREESLRAMGSEFDADAVESISASLSRS
jgi:NitT/TauT family transport system ATP-binding protein